MIVAEKATNALASPNATAGMLVAGTLNQAVAESLMIAFTMIVDHELGERTAEVLLTQRNETVQAFLFN